MNMISTGSFLTETGASNKKSELLKTLTAAWEKKNANAARTGGVSLMALTLAACGSSEDTTAFSQADVDAAKAEGEAAGAAAEAAAMIDAINEALGTSLTGDEDAAAIIATIAASNDADIAAEATEAAEAAAATAAEAAAATAAEALAASQAETLAAQTAAADAATAAAAELAAVQAQLDALQNPTPQNAILTTSNEVVNGTVANDTITAAVGTLNAADAIIDSTSSDSDVLNATVANATTAPRISGIETINLTGELITVGLDLGSVSGATTVTAATNLPAGTATFTNAAASAASTISSGANVTTLAVSSAAAGTGAAGVNVNGGAETTAINITGGAGVDVFTITPGVTAATVDLTTIAAADTINVVNNFAAVTIDAIAAAAVGTINVNSSVDSAVTITTGIGAATDFTGAGNVTLTTTSAIAATSTATTSTGAGTLTLNMTAITDGDDVSVVAADVINHADTTGAAGLTIASGTTLNLDAALGASSTFDLSAAGTMTVTASQSQAQDVVTGAAVTSLVISATPDAATDTDADSNGTAETQITLTNLDTATGTNTETVVVIGSADLELTTFTNDATASLFNSTAMTGDLTIGTTTAAGTFYLGSGDDNVTVGNVASTIYGNAGDDTLTGGTAADTIYGGDGDDTIAGGGTNANTIVAGAGDDSVTATAADTISLGSGSDTVTGANDVGYTVSDFNINEDTLVITGTATAGVDLGNITPTAGAYDLLVDATADVTLTGVTATDVTGFVQLGTAAANYVAADATVIVAGDASDHIGVATTESATITTGAGSDTVYLASGAASAVTVSDFTVGSDKVVITGAMSDGTSIDLDAIVPVSGAYTVDATAVVTITGSTATDVSGYFQLGASGSVLSLDNGSNAVGGISAYGSDFSDFVSLGTIGTTATTFYFTDNGGVDTITGVVANSALSAVSFTDLTGITGTGTAVAANAAKIADAADGAVYVFASAADGTGSEAISTFTENAANGITAATILADVASFLEAGLGETAGEKYVAVINDGTTKAYAYLVEADSDGIDAADLTLLGTIDATAAALITATDIV